MKQKMSEADWVNLITGACDIHGAVSDFTSIFLKIGSKGGSERGGVSLDELSFFINIFMVFQYNLPLADFNL
jgi:hypothetical protein